MQQLLSLYIRKKLELQVEVGRGGGGKSPKGSRHLQGKRKKESQKKKKNNWFSSLMFIAPREKLYLRDKITFFFLLRELFLLIDQKSQKFI